MINEIFHNYQNPCDIEVFGILNILTKWGKKTAFLKEKKYRLFIKIKKNLFLVNKVTVK